MRCGFVSCGYRDPLFQFIKPLFRAPIFLCSSHALCTLSFALVSMFSVLDFSAVCLILSSISSLSLLSCAALQRVRHISAESCMSCFLIFRARLSAVASLMPI